MYCTVHSEGWSGEEPGMVPAPGLVLESESETGSESDAG